MNQTGGPIKTASLPRTNIPTVLTSFIGRKHEMMELADLLASSRLVTLTGAAGCGKTRLAMRLAENTGPRFADGAHWVVLARISDPSLIPKTIAKGLHVAEQPDRPSLESLLSVLHDKQLLLVLDNCEHLLYACAQLVETLLSKTEVSILATSREPLGLVGERLYPLAPMSLPPPTVSMHDVHDVGQFEAIRLFVERAGAILPAFELTGENAGLVANICRKLNGVPLAIELASARINVLTTGQIAARLDHLFELLPAATHLTFSHHDTLRAAIDWSHDLLTQSEQVMLRRLSVFAAGCSLATAEAVCTGDDIQPGQVLELLSSLAKKSLLVSETLRRGEARYTLLETIRQYAQEKLVDSGEWSALHHRHLQCFLRLAEETVLKLRGPYQQLWLNWLEGEYDNIRAALAWSLEADSLESGRIEAGLRMGIALYQFWTIRDYVEEGLTWFEQLLGRAEDAIPGVLRANALAYAAFLAGFRGNVSVQVAYGRKAAAWAEAAGDEGTAVLVWALAAQGYGARATGDYQTEFVLSQRVIQLYRQLGDPYELGRALSVYSVTAMALRKYEIARGMLEEGLMLLRQAGNPYRIAMALNFSGDLARCEGDYARAQTEYEESISLLGELDAARDLASVLQNLGHTCLHLGDVERAAGLFHQSLASHQAQQNRPGLAESLLGFAALAIVSDLPAAGTRLLAAAAALGGRHITSEWAATRMEYEHYLARMRADLSESEFFAQQEAGKKLPVEQALAYAQEVALEAETAQITRKKPDALTARERQVAALVAQAMSNGEIAEQLVVSKRTVEKHISNIRSKLGFDRRAQIVRWAISAGLVNKGD